MTASAPNRHSRERGNPGPLLFPLFLDAGSESGMTDGTFGFSGGRGSGVAGGTWCRRTDDACVGNNPISP